MTDIPARPSRLTLSEGPDRLIAALRLVRQGRVHDLSVPLTPDTPNDPGMGDFVLVPTHTPQGTDDGSGFQFCAERLSGAVHLGTHIDALVHVQHGDRIFGGHAVEDVLGPSGWAVHGAGTIGPILRRGVLLDVPALLGLPRLPDGFEVTPEHVTACLSAAGLSVGEGDVVMVRTGKIADLWDRAAYVGAEPGVGREAALMLADMGMAVLATDTPGTEPAPFPDPANTTHRAMLVDRGIHLIETCDLEGIAALGLREGMFVALPLRIQGASGSWIRPVLLT